MNRKITFVHLFNDYSGSPLILSTVIKGMQQKGFECEIITCSGGEGFLSNIPGCSYEYFKYHWHRNRYIRLLLYLWSQILLFGKIYGKRKQGRIIYINTLLPFGAAIAARSGGNRVIYHIHEVSIKPAPLKWFLKWIAGRFADHIVYVSRFLQVESKLEKVSGTTVYNALSEAFIEDAVARKLLDDRPESPFTVLMLCSLKDYKGVKEFVEIAKTLKHTRFKLVANAEQKSIDRYFEGVEIPPNLCIFPKQTNVHPFYRKSHLVLNLSHPEQWVETFGMTLLEGMYYGLPCIAPPVGGPAEIVEHQKDGFLIDQRELGKIVKCIELLKKSPDLYASLSVNAKKKAARFRYQDMIDRIHELI